MSALPASDPPTVTWPGLDPVMVTTLESAVPVPVYQPVVSTVASLVGASAPGDADDAKSFVFRAPVIQSIEIF
jgi:hypothetical protein